MEALGVQIPEPARHQVEAELERIHAPCQEFNELRLLNAIRTGMLALDEAQAADAERLLGGSGHEPAARFDLDPAAGPDEVMGAAVAAIDRWQRRAESPMSARPVAEAARVLVRVGEGIVADLAVRA